MRSPSHFLPAVLFCRSLRGLLVLVLCGSPPAAGQTFTATTAQTVFNQEAQKLKLALGEIPTNRYPRSTDSTGKWITNLNTEPVAWTQGFFPGNLWFMFEHSRDPLWRSAADVWTRNLEVQKTNTQTHDLGFKMWNSFGTAYRVTREPYYRDVVLAAAESLASRYRPAAQVISTGDWNPDWKLPMVVDTMINLELLFWASENGGRPEWKQLALSHALTTLREIVRPNGSTYHVVDFDPGTGAVRFKKTYQGAADESTWSRGQVWAFYGFIMAYRYSKDARMLEAARKTADYYLSRLPSNGVPNWDFDSNLQSPDSSAAAAAASALLELATFETIPANSTRYRDAALNMLSTLATPAYLSSGTANRGLLLHGVGHLPAGKEVDVSLIYGDYYYLEAVLRYLYGSPSIPFLRVVLPNGGETLRPGQIQAMRWSTFSGVGRVHLDVSYDGGGSWQRVQTDLLNTGEYFWTVPATATNRGLFRVSPTGGRARPAVSANSFTIGGITAPPPVFNDEFNRSGTLGGTWIPTRGSFSANGSAAVSARVQSYAFWNGSPALNDTSVIRLSTPIKPTYVGALARAANDGSPDREHYGAFVAPDGLIYLARRDNWSYTFLATGPRFPSGTHELSLTASGTGPVSLSVKLDGTQVLSYSDSSARARKNAGRAGIVDYNGAGQTIDRFAVTR